MEATHAATDGATTRAPTHRAAILISRAALGLGGVLGSFMSWVVLKTLVQDFAHPNLGWGVMGLFVIQPIALLITVPSAIAMVLLAPAADRRVSLGIATAIVLWVAFAMVGLAFHNSGC